MKENDSENQKEEKLLSTASQTKRNKSTETKGTTRICKKKEEERPESGQTNPENIKGTARQRREREVNETNFERGKKTT